MFSAQFWVVIIITLTLIRLFLLFLLIVFIPIGFIYSDYSCHSYGSGWGLPAPPPPIDFQKYSYSSPGIPMAIGDAQPPSDQVFLWLPRYSYVCGRRRYNLDLTPQWSNDHVFCTFRDVRIIDPTGNQLL